MASEKNDKEVATTEEFGSERLKELMIAAVNDIDKMKELLREVGEIIYKYATYRFICGFKAGEVWENSKPIVAAEEFKKDKNTSKDGGIDKDRCNDFVGMVFVEVANSLPRFLLNLYKYPEANQRRAWLRSIVYKKLASYLADCWKEYIWQNSKKESLYVTVDNDENDGELVEKKLPNALDTEPVLFNEYLKDSTTCELIMSEICGLKAKPHSIIIFIINKVIVFADQDCKQNCDAKETCKILNGATLFELKNIIIDKFREIYELDIDRSVLKPLDEKLGKDVPCELGNVKFRYVKSGTGLKNGEVLFNERSLANTTNRVSEKLKARITKLKEVKYMFEN